MRLTFTIVVLLLLQNVGSAQLIKPIEERPAFPERVERESEVPFDLTGKATLTFVDFGIVFDGGSYSAQFRRDDGHHLVIYFLHPGYWTKQAIKDKTQPIEVDLDAERDEEGEVRLEVVPDSPFEKRLVGLLNDSLATKAYRGDQIKTLTQIRDCVRDRKPLPELRKRFPGWFKH